MKKAIFIDIDGTLRDNARQVRNRTKQAIERIRQLGYLIVLCSGRARNYTIQVSKECRGSHYVITSNGAEIYNYQTNEIVASLPMQKQACRQLYQLAEENDVKIAMNTGNYRVVNTDRSQQGDILLQESIDDFLENHTIIQCVISGTNLKQMIELRKQVQNIEKIEIKNESRCLTDVTIKPTQIIYFDLANNKASKGNAVRKLCEVLAIDLKNTIAIGDSANDISMFQQVGHAVAMGNATNALKQYADEITDTNDRDGVARYLEKLE